MISTAAVALDQVLAENEAHLHHNKPYLVGALVLCAFIALLLITLSFNRDR
ncbi:MAG TPA: hypothetical protein VGL04_00795 [Sporichthyaceae bacterium]|jgi:hypothetical protein